MTPRLPDRDKLMYQRRRTRLLPYGTADGRPAGREEQVGMNRIEALSRTISLAVVLAALTVGSMALAHGGDNSGPGSGGSGPSGSNGRRGGNDGRVRIDMRLLPTAEGVAAGLKGKARIEARPSRGREKLKVEAESRRLAEGTVLHVFVAHPAAGETPVFVGQLVLRARFDGEVEDELELDSERSGIPAGISPVTGITGISVVDPASGVTLLAVQR
jgi:hypothetical protein